MNMRSSRIVRLNPGLQASESVFKRILVAVDGSQSSLRAAKVGVRLAKRNEAELIVVSVVPRPTYALTPISTVSGTGRRVDSFTPGSTSAMPEYYGYASKSAEHWVDEAVSLAKAQDVPVKRRVLKGAASVVEAITNYSAAQNVDLIVLGTKGSGGFKRLLLGSVSSGVVNHAATSVLVVR
jgi:nucleotide-binding universal stress UspA family protein